MEKQAFTEQWLSDVARVLNNAGLAIISAEALKEIQRQAREEACAKCKWKEGD